MAVTSSARRVSAGVGTSNDHTRRHNLSTVLTALHHEGAQPRAQLTRRLGLNRSTISALVGELGDLGLAYETAPADGRGVGRPSPTVQANEKVVAIAVNPDTDAVTIGLVGLGGVVHTRLRHETAGPPSVRETVDIVAASVKTLAEAMAGELEGAYRVAGVGLAVPGLVRAGSGVVTLAPHLGWHDEPLAERVSEALGLPTAVTNDANAGAIAESIYGAGQGVGDLVYLNGSSGGIGGGVLVGGMPLRGASGFGAELGHTRAPGSGLQCRCGRHGCLETEVSLERLLAAAGRASVDADDLDRLLTPGTAPALDAEVDRQIEVLSVVLADYVSVFNPQRIVLGGFLGSLMSAHPERLIESVRAGSFGPLAGDLSISRATLRTRLLIVGAAEAAFQALLADPAGAVTRPLGA